MTQGHFHRSRFAQVCSWEVFKLLEDRVKQAQTLPCSRMSVSDYFPKSKSANLFTKVILFWLKQDGVFCYRNSSQGTARRQRDGRVIFTPGSKYGKGQGDVYALINGGTVFIEVKVGRDRLSPPQARFKAEVERSGGYYLVVRSFDDFLQQYNSTLQQMTTRCPHIIPDEDSDRRRYWMEGEKGHGNPATI